MGGQRLAVESDGAVPLDTMLKEGVRGRPDVSALASLDKNKLCVLVWHYHDDDVPGPDAAVELVIDGLPLQAARLACAFRIDGATAMPLKFGDKWVRLNSRRPINTPDWKGRPTGTAR